MMDACLQGRYEILEEIGSGGMAIVYKAKDNLLNRFVAVKVLRTEHVKDDEFIKRFDVEAKAAASLNHHNIVSIYDVGCQGDYHYIVMEYIEGRTLKDYIDKRGRIPYKRALNYSMQICAALEHAHAGHIIHRDIKPHNIMVSSTGSVKVTDFGIARATTSATTTIGTAVLGSAHYLSPEQARGGFMDERSDIYSLGVCMYEMFTGRLPFDGETPVAVAMQHLQKEPTAPRLINDEIPEAVEYIILKAMRKEQRQRYASAKEMFRDMQRVASNPNIVLSDDDSPSDDSIFSTKQIPVITPELEREAEEAERIKKEEKEKLKLQKQKREKLKLYGVIAASVVVIAVAIAIIFSVFLQGPEMLVPNLKGLTFSQAEEKLAELSVDIKLILSKEEVSTHEEKGKIISQDPVADEKMGSIDEIYVIVGMGEETFKLPDYTTWRAEDAEKDIVDRGLLCRIELEDDDELNEQYPKGRITRQVPSAKSSVQSGDTVTIFESIGEGQKDIRVPNLIGDTVENASRRLSDIGLKIGEIVTRTTDGEPNIILEQAIDKDTMVDEGTEISVVVSKRQEVVTGEATISFKIPDTPDNMLVKIVRKNTGATVYTRMHRASDTVSVSVKGQGTESYEIYIDGVHYKDESVTF